MLTGKHILIVDDSAAMRDTLKLLLESENATTELAADPFEAVKALRCRVPDAIILDLEMPKMDGLTFLSRLMAQHPLPVVVCSATAAPGSAGVFRALETGALEVVEKPTASGSEILEDFRLALVGATVRAVSVPRERLLSGYGKHGRNAPEAVLKRHTRPPRMGPCEVVIVIGASTGGTRALAEFLSRIPLGTPGIVIVQHMPAAFTGPFAQHLNTLCAIDVREAVDKDTVEAGTALIAPGGRHTLLRRDGTGYAIEVRDGPLVNRHRPSVDILFRSAAQIAAAKAVGVILTGMGDDGALCMKELHDAGATTFAQDEDSCVVFGMPKEAIRLGGIDRVLSLLDLPAAVVTAAHSKQGRRVV